MRFSETNHNTAFLLQNGGEFKQSRRSAMNIISNLTQKDIDLECFNKECIPSNGPSADKGGVNIE